jgi:hypothetical protein
MFLHWTIIQVMTCGNEQWERTELLVSRWNRKKEVLNYFLRGPNGTCVRTDEIAWEASRKISGFYGWNSKYGPPKSKQSTGLHSHIPDAKPSFLWTLFKLPPFSLLSYSKAYWPVFVTQTSNTSDISAGNYGKKLFNVYIFYVKVLLSWGWISNRGGVLIRLLNSSYPGMII